MYKKHIMMGKELLHLYSQMNSRDAICCLTLGTLLFLL